ncbi:MAG TPA: DUF2007 domain-containing protein [Polyangiaceae bacterium]
MSDEPDETPDSEPPASERPDEEWVELRRYNDPIEADMAKDFLETSGVRVLTRGNSGVTGVLNRFDTVLDIRLVVPKSELDEAREALEALNAPPRQSSPFRGFGKTSEEEDAEPDHDDRWSRNRQMFFAGAVGTGLVAGVLAALHYFFG